jgi:hypothetical protein
MPQQKPQTVSHTTNLLTNLQPIFSSCLFFQPVAPQCLIEGFSSLFLESGHDLAIGIKRYAYAGMA